MLIKLLHFPQETSGSLVSPNGMRNGCKPFNKKTEGKSMRTFSPCPLSSCALSRGDRQPGTTSTPTIYRVGLCPSLLFMDSHRSLQIWSRYHWDHFWDSFSFPLTPACVPAMLVTPSQLDTALPTALSSLREMRIDDFQAQHLPEVVVTVKVKVSQADYSSLAVSRACVLSQF